MCCILGNELVAVSYVPCLVFLHVGMKVTLATRYLSGRIIMENEVVLRYI